MMKHTNRVQKLAAVFIAGLLAVQLFPMSAMAQSSPPDAAEKAQTAALPSFTPLYGQYGLKSEIEYAGETLLTNGGFDENSLNGWDVEGYAEVLDSGEIYDSFQSPYCSLAPNSTLSQSFTLPELLEEDYYVRFQIAQFFEAASEEVSLQSQLRLEAYDENGNLLAENIGSETPTVLFIYGVKLLLPAGTKTITARVVNLSSTMPLLLEAGNMDALDPKESFNLFNNADFNGIVFGMNGWVTSNIFAVKYATETGLRDRILNDRTMCFPADKATNMYQEVLLDGKAGEEYDLALWAKAAATAGTGKVFSMAVQVPSADGQRMEEISRYNFNTGNPDWQYGTKSFTLPRDCSKLRVYFYYEGQSTPAWVDGAQLFKRKPVVHLLKNGSFENGMTDWTARGDTCSFITDTQANTGKKSAFFAYFANTPMNNYIEQTAALTKGGRITFSAYVKADTSLSGAGAQLVLETKRADGTILDTAYSQTVSDTGGGWQKVSITLDAPSAAKSVTAKIGGISCTGAFYVDDAELTHIS